NVLAVGHVLLRDVEDVAVGIVRADPRKGPVRRPLLPLHHRIMLAHAVEGGLSVLDLDTEMVEPGWAPGAPRIDVQPDISIAHRPRSRGTRLRRRGHAEDRLVELAQLRIVLADDGDVIKLGEHETSRAPPVEEEQFFLLATL